MKKIYCIAAAMLVAACGSSEQTSGFFVGAISRDGSQTPSQSVEQSYTEQPAALPGDTLLNCTFERALDRPFGPDIPYNVFNSTLHIDNQYFDDPVVLLCSAGLIKDGLVEAVFKYTESPASAVVGILLRADGADNFLLLGVNGRGQYTIQRCLNGLWMPVMGLDSFEKSRLLPFRLDEVMLTAEVHGNYTDFSVNGQLIQVVRTQLPPTGQVGVFIDAYMNTELDRITVMPF
jgi:hypothetical protein